MRNGAGNVTFYEASERMEIRVLSFEGCPHFEATIILVGTVLRELGLQNQVNHVQIKDEAEAAEYHFLGSPAVQVDGKDIEVGRRGELPFFGCRLYRHGTSAKGVSPKEMIIKAIQEAQPHGASLK